MTRSPFSREHGWTHATAVRSAEAAEKRDRFVKLVNRGYDREWAMGRVEISARTARRYLREVKDASLA
jgi:hypothetical protein